MYVVRVNLQLATAKAMTTAAGNVLKTNVLTTFNVAQNSLEQFEVTKVAFE